MLLIFTRPYSEVRVAHATQTDAAATGPLFLRNTVHISYGRYYAYLDRTNLTTGKTFFKVDRSLRRKIGGIETEILIYSEYNNVLF